MKKIIQLSLILCLSCPLWALGASSPMVERHIFSPEPDGKGSHKSPMTLKLEKELMFTGVIISSQGKWAIIREKGKRKDEEVSGLRKEGDEIKGMVIKKIASNFLILAGEGKEVRLNLYHEGKPRPAMPAGSESPFVSTEKIPKETPVPSSKSKTTPSRIKSINPRARASKTPTRAPQQKSSASPPKANPFQQKTPPTPFQQGTQNPFLNQNPTPFPQETPPNPFLQQAPPNPYLEQPPNADVE